MKARTPKPHFDHLATVVTDEADGFALAAIATITHDTSLIPAPYLKLVRIEERIEVCRARDYHLASHGQKVDRTPDGPPATRPAASLTQWCAVVGEGTQDVHDPIKPEVGKPIDG